MTPTLESPCISPDSIKNENVLIVLHSTLNNEVINNEQIKLKYMLLMSHSEAACKYLMVYFIIFSNL